MTTVATILLSYNRPRMLCEALSTCLDADQLIVTDDGSDFDVQALVRGCRPDAQFVINGPMTVAERLKTPRLGNLINRALSLVTCDTVTYLCDDDLFHPQWLPAVRAWFRWYPDQHWARGAWYAFEESDQARIPTRCPLDGRQLTTGNFAHRIGCFREENVRWDETTVASHDNAFLWSAAKHHDMHRVPFIPVVAGWRRLHKHNALPYAAGHDYAHGAAALFREGFLEEA
jgi:glycosyltransferase involved in cell wall biosynthesis